MLDAYDRAEGVGQVVGQLAAATRAGEAGQKGAGKSARVEAARFRVAERVFGEGGRSGFAGHGVGVGEGGIEAEQDGEDPAPAGGGRYGPAVEGGLLDLSGDGRNPCVPHPCLAGGVELGGLEPIEQVAEEVGVVLAHT